MRLRLHLHQQRVCVLALGALLASTASAQDAAKGETPAPSEAPTPAGEGADSAGGEADKATGPAAQTESGGGGDGAAADAGEDATLKVGDELAQGTGRKLSDRISAVSRKVFIREGRFELAPLVGLSINDAFFLRTTVGGRASYHIFESLSLDVGLHGNVWPFALPAVRTVRAELNPIVDEFLVWGFADAGISFAPIYGKFALMSEWTVHFDTFFTAGAGLILENSGQTFWGLQFNPLFEIPIQTNPPGLGGTLPIYPPNLDPAAQVGFGGRIFLLRWLALRGEIRNYLYPRFGGALFPPRKISQLPVRHLAMLHFGVAFYLPPDFEYAYEGARVNEK